ncbi:uncharacterized protein LOC106173861 [Lingula anatina]|uniref:Uncharacterized protein LOC106173861 n=1 Tax=Lingula anatina TaxID=7574 RepID=A0A1S3JJL6_LINAN|nr:uncharacterized protein LOC106173861 [Lingula anatina]|eukprot:XP_013410605.1 uncharacterized protein LOC106173861 [Lingula anatina]
MEDNTQSDTNMGHMAARGPRFCSDPVQNRNAGRKMFQVLNTREQVVLDKQEKTMQKRHDREMKIQMRSQEEYVKKLEKYERKRCISFSGRQNSMDSDVEDRERKSTNFEQSTETPSTISTRPKLYRLQTQQILNVPLSPMVAKHSSSLRSHDGSDMDYTRHRSHTSPELMQAARARLLSRRNIERSHTIKDTTSQNRTAMNDRIPERGRQVKIETTDKLEMGKASRKTTFSPGTERYISPLDNDKSASEPSQSRPRSHHIHNDHENKQYSTEGAVLKKKQNNRKWTENDADHAFGPPVSRGRAYTNPTTTRTKGVVFNQRSVTPPGSGFSPEPQQMPGMVFTPVQESRSVVWIRQPGASYGRRQSCEEGNTAERLAQITLEGRARAIEDRLQRLREKTVERSNLKPNNSFINDQNISTDKHEFLPPLYKQSLQEKHNKHFTKTSPPGDDTKLTALKECRYLRCNMDLGGAESTPD